MEEFKKRQIIKTKYYINIQILRTILFDGCDRLKMDAFKFEG